MTFVRFSTVGRCMFSSVSSSVCQNCGKGVAMTCSTGTPVQRHGDGDWASVTYSPTFIHVKSRVGGKSLETDIYHSRNSYLNSLNCSLAVIQLSEDQKWVYFCRVETKKIVLKEAPLHWTQEGEVPFNSLRAASELSFSCKYRLISSFVLCLRFGMLTRMWISSLYKLLALYFNTCSELLNFCPRQTVHIILITRPVPKKLGLVGGYCLCSHLPLWRKGMWSSCTGPRYTSFLKYVCSEGWEVKRPCRWSLFSERGQRQNLGFTTGKNFSIRGELDAGTYLQQLGDQTSVQCYQSD